MELIKFRHSCKIERFIEFNELGEEIYELLYDGECLYQEKTQVYVSGGIAQRSPICFLPKNDVLFAMDDIVTITADKGRVIVSYIDIPRDIDSALISCTRLELKQARDN